MSDHITQAFGLWLEARKKEQAALSSVAGARLRGDAAALELAHEELAELRAKADYLLACAVEALGERVAQQKLRSRFAASQRTWAGNYR
jgi:hypothetical protein